MIRINLLQTESRWLLAVMAAAAVLLMTYVGDIEAILGEINVLQNDINDVREQINLQVNAPAENIEYANENENIHISELLQYMEDKDASLQMTDDNQYMLEINMRDVVELQQLMYLLLQHDNKYFINDFSMSTTELKQLHLMIDLEVDAGTVKSNTKMTMPSFVQIPFCHLPLTQQVLSDQATRYALQDLHVLGMIHKQGSKRALLAFPNGVTRIMNVQDYLGKEGGVITAITDKTVVVTLPNHKEVICALSAFCYS